MIGKGKKTVSLAYKDKLVAEIAYYEKRISEALQRSNSHSVNSFEEVESSDDDTNPYTLNVGPSGYELKQLEASLGSRASMTLELAMLTIMQSEVNVMMTAPDVRRPVKEDGTWLEVAAECKIDLVSFTIAFYAHKPERKFAPTRYRNVDVTLSKAAHEKELAQSVLSKLKLPNLALQVLQSYATAFRSRRTTLLELAEKYAEKLRMEAMPEGGYRVRFLDLLTVDWSLENLWSPIVPFCPRMKFEVEYMPREYIHSIGRLYKQFKDPSLETDERTHVLSQIFDTCLLAQGPARDMQESVESDPDTAGRLHERRTTIDQEPEMPSSYVQASPKKLSKGKENKAQNRKTAMEPPKAIPKKAKKVGTKKSRPNSEVNNDERNVSKKSKASDKDVISDNQIDVSKKSKPNDKEDLVENRKGIKRGIENDTHANSNAKKIRSDNDSNNSKSSADKASMKSGKASDVINQHDASGSQNNAPKKDGKVASAKNEHSKHDPNKKGDLKSASATSLKKKNVDDNVVNEKNGTKAVGNAKEKEAKASVENSKSAKNKPDKESVVNLKPTKDSAGSSKKTANKKNTNSGTDSVTSKNSTQKSGESKSSKMVRDKNSADKGSSKNITQKTGDGNSNAVSKNLRENEPEVLENIVEQNIEKNANKVAKVTKTNNIVDKTVDAKVQKVQANSDEAMAKNETKKVGNGETIATSKNMKVKNTDDSKNVKQKNLEKSNNVRKFIKPNVDAVIKETGSIKATTLKEFVEAPAKRKVAGDNITTGANNEVSKDKVVKKTVKSKITDKTFTKSNDAKSVDTNNVEYKEKEQPVNAKNNDVRNSNTKTMAQKNTTNAISNNNKKNNDGKNNKITAVPNLLKSRTVSKVHGEKENVEAKKSNRNVTVDKVTEKNKVSGKSTAAKISTNIQSKPKTNKADDINPKSTLFHKQAAVTEKRVYQKFAENQAKINEKLKTKIPIMKSKMKISTLSSKLDRNAAAKAVDVKTKIPQKSLPVFKKIVKKNPTRISPRKLTSFKPSHQGFSSK